MKQIAARVLLNHVWKHGKKDSWERINHSMRNALSLAIGSGLSFHHGDFDYFASEFRWHYWVGDPEWIYAKAIINGNLSCIEAWEMHKHRTPFRANDVRADVWSGYIHRHSIHRERERLFVGAAFKQPLPSGNAINWKVTGFNDDKGIVRAVSADHRKAFTHDDLKELFPAPETIKKRALKNAPVNYEISECQSKP